MGQTAGFAADHGLSDKLLVAIRGFSLALCCKVSYSPHSSLSEGLFFQESEVIAGGDPCYRQ